MSGLTNLKRNKIMKKLLVIILLMSTICYSQIHLQDKDRYSIQITTDNVVFQKGLFYGGLEFQSEFSNGIYVRPQIHYTNLKDGYLETSAGIGLNLSYNSWNYKLGIKLGVINRADIYPIFGFEAGIEYHITNKLGFGLRGSYDARGDADFYDGDKWRYNSQGYIKFIIN